MKKFVVNHDGRVFVPSSGDLFLMTPRRATNIDIKLSRFRPLFWGFVFNSLMSRHAYVATTLVFVPSSGDLFLMPRRATSSAIKLSRVFVPSSGDLFLIKSGGKK